IEKAIVDPLGLAQQTFARKAQPLRDGATAHVARGALYGDAVEAHAIHKIVNHGGAAAGHDAAALKARGEPVADAAMAGGPIDGMASNGSGDLAIDADSRLRSLVGLPLVANTLDEVTNILRGFGVIHPRQPFAEIDAVTLHQIEDFLGVAEFEQVQADLRS